MGVVRGVLAPLLLFSFVIIGCSPRESESVVLTVGKENVNLKEYENFYTRNSGGLDAGRKSTQEEREHFLDLLTNYKLKLQDAYDRNLLKDPEIIDELRQYRSSLTSSFIIDKEITEPAVHQMYERRQEEIRAQHILIQIKPDAKPEDTLKAWNTAMDAIHRAIAGENFDSLVIKFSDDRTASMNHGDLYYFTGGQMVPQFENAAFAMKKGEINKTPVRSSFGYHIIKIVDRRPTRGTLKARHLMARWLGAADSSDTAASYTRIKGMLDSLNKGWDFSKLAMKLSEDPGSAPKGGDLGWFERRKWVQQFDEVVFNLKTGETSGIIRSPYGYHIIRCDSVKPLPSFAELHDEIKKLYQQYRFNDDYAAYITTLKKEYKYTFNEEAFSALVSHVDSLRSVGDSSWDNSVPKEVRSMVIMSIEGEPLTVDSLIGIFNKRSEFTNLSLRRSDLKTRIDKLSESLVMGAHSSGLEHRSPEFAALLKEYQDGVVLYKAEQLEVWNKIAVSDSMLKQYFEHNRSKFQYPQRVDISQIHCDSDTLAAMVYDSLKNGADFGELAGRYNNDDPDIKAKNGERGLLAIDTDDITQRASQMEIGELSLPIEIEGGGAVIVKLNSKEPAKEKTFEEAGAEVSNSFQENESKRLEDDWLTRLRNKYLVQQFKEQLQNAFK